MLFWAFMVIALGVGVFLELPSKQLIGGILMGAGAATAFSYIFNNRKNKDKHGLFGVCWCQPGFQQAHQKSEGESSDQS